MARFVFLSILAMAAIFTSVPEPYASGQTQATAIYSFNSAPDGNYPDANLVLDSSGNLYGTTVGGGSAGQGIVFELKPSGTGWSEIILYSFCQATGCTDGSAPMSSLVIDNSGVLYGTTYQGGAYGYGTVFKLAPQTGGAWRQSVIHSFGNGADGRSPFGGLVFDKTGNLYGTTFFGGTSITACSSGCGSVFEMTHQKSGLWNERVLYSFCSQTSCADGSEPTGALVLDSANHLYGTTESGGSVSNYGTVFDLTKGANGQWKQRVLHVFNAGASDGGNPLGGLTIDGSGNLYGTTTSGGKGGNNGTVFELVRNKTGGWSERILYSFCTQFGCADGSYPIAPVIISATGVVYGTTDSGGGVQSGVVFQLTSDSNGKWTETILNDFTDPALGFNPHAGVILDASGNLYGVTYQGGAGGFGTAFELIP